MVKSNKLIDMGGVQIMANSNRLKSFAVGQRVVLNTRTFVRTDDEEQAKIGAKIFVEKRLDTILEIPKRILISWWRKHTDEPIPPLLGRFLYFDSAKIIDVKKENLFIVDQQIILSGYSIINTHDEEDAKIISTRLVSKGSEIESRLKKMDHRKFNGDTLDIISSENIDVHQIAHFGANGEWHLIPSALMLFRK